MKISVAQYAQTLLELTENKSEQESLAVVIKFVQQLKKDGQFKNVGAIMEKFEQLYNREHGIIKAEITTKYKIQETKYKQIEDFIKTKYAAETIESENIIDEKIKGGIVIRVGDEVIDGSVGTQLKKLKNLLSK